MKNPLEEVQNAAIKAIKVFSAVYHKSIEPAYIAWIEKFLKSAIKDVNVCVMRGYTRALGVISPVL